MPPMNAWSFEKSLRASLRHFGTIFTGWLSQTNTLHSVYILVYKLLHHMVPSYLSVTCVPVSTVLARRSLRSAANGDLLILRTRTTGCGPCIWAVSGLRCCKGLTSALKSPSLLVNTIVLMPTQDSAVLLWLYAVLGSISKIVDVVHSTA